MRKTMFVLLSAFLFFVMSGCCEMEAAYQPKPAPAAPAPKSMAKPVAKADSGAVSRTLPCEGCGVIRVDKMMPKQVQLNSPFDYKIKVTNLTDMPVVDVIVTEWLADNFKLGKTSAPTKVDDNVLTWQAGALGPRESKELTISGMATSTKLVRQCAVATYLLPLCASTEVVEAKLSIIKTIPADALICDTIPLKLIVQNSGTGTAKNVKVVDELPAGLKTMDGKTQLVYNIDALGAGQTKELTANLRADKTGKYTNKAVATADGGLTAETLVTETTVRQPILGITKTGAENKFLTRPATYVIEITNTGDAVAKHMTLEDTIPQGMKFLEANHNGIQKDGKVVWNLPDLLPGKKHGVGVTYTSEQEGSYTNRATAKADCAAPVSASATTVFKGIPAVLLEVIDLEDPLELGNLETYVISVTNQGSTNITNANIVCAMEENVTYYSSSGPTKVSVKGSIVSFAPLPTLTPKDTATWKVVVKSVTPGDTRFKVTLNSDQLRRPVEETESTEVYE